MVEISDVSFFMEIDTLIRSTITCIYFLFHSTLLVLFFSFLCSFQEKNYENNMLAPPTLGFSPPSPITDILDPPLILKSS